MRVRISVLIAAVCTTFGTASAGADVIHTFSCTIRDGADTLEVFARSAEWLKAARSDKGGKNIKVRLEFPLAAEAGFRGFNYVVISPNLEEWGTFYDNYATSQALKADGPWEKVALCTKSVLYSGFEIEPPK